MKVSAMNSDQYKISIEAHPLQVLYSKYSDADDDIHYQAVRPLGKIRQIGRPSSDYHTCRATKGSWNGEKSVNGKKEMKLDSRLYSNRTKCNSDQNIATSGAREKDVTNILPSLRRSKTQAFEEKFKIAASRQSAETPSPQLRQNKKVVHLPLFKINLRTFVGEEEVSRTVAKTRESLRKLMDLNKAKMRNANIITANIKNYEFNAPISNSTLAREHTIDSARNIVSLPFHAKPALRASRDSSRDRNSTVRQNSQYSRSNTYIKFGVSEINGNNDAKCQIKTGKQTPDNVKASKRHISDSVGPDDEPDGSTLSLAIRPDTSLTLGTTMHQIDRVIKTPTSDELREIAEAFKNSDTSNGWPNSEDIQSMIARNNSRTTKSRTPFSRPTTVLNNVPEIEDESRKHKQNYFCNSPHEHGHKYSPVLRYTSKQSTYKLEPIIVPSHTCTECPMCNSSQREVETPCPPNTPNTQFMYETNTSQTNRNMYEYDHPQVSRTIYRPSGTPQASRIMYDPDNPLASRYVYDPDLHQRSRTMYVSDMPLESRKKHATNQKSRIIYGLENHSRIAQGSKMTNVHNKPEVLRVSRINMNGYTSPEDDSSKISFMKTF